MSQPRMAWGPPITPTIRGRVTNGPTPTMSMTFKLRAEAVDSPRRNSLGAGWSILFGR